MSGHSHFQSIGSVVNAPVNLPQANNNIIEVVGNNPVGGANDGVGGGREVPHEAAVGEKANPAKALMRQLDILLARAAANSTKAADAGAVKHALQKLELPEQTRSAIAELADKAEASFKAINAFTGRQIGESMSLEGGQIVWAQGNAAAEAIRKAIDAQLDLSGILTKLVNRMPCCEIASALEEAAMQSDRRASEIQMLANEFADIAEKGEKASPEIKARLDETLERLLPRKSLEMHGNEDAVAAMKAQVEPLAKRLDEVSRNPGASLSKQDVAAVKREIDMMSNALDAAVQRGFVNTPGAGGPAQGIVNIDRSLLSAAKDVLNAVKGRISNARSEIASASIRNFADKVFQMPEIKIGKCNVKCKMQNAKCNRQMNQ